MKNLVSFIILTISILALSAQTNLFTLTGKVVEEDGKTPLPYANVMLKGTPYGDITNTKGVFRFSVPAVDTANGTVQISFVGYQTKTVAVKDLGKPIRLKNNAIELKEFTKTEYITPDALLKEVVRRIPENYHTDTLVSNYYYRDWRTLNDSLYFFLEAPYIRRFHPPLGKGTSVDFGHPGNYIHCSAGFRHVMDLDLVNSLVYRDTMGLYKFYTNWNINQVFDDGISNISYNGGIKGWKKLTLSQFTDDQGNNFYKIKAYDKKDTSKANYLFTMIINKQDYAITEMTTQVINPNRKLVPRILMAFGSAKSLYHNMYVIKTYYRKIDGKYIMYRYTSDIDEHMETKEKYVEKGAAKKIKARQNIVYQWQGYAKYPDNDTNNLSYRSKMRSKNKFIVAVIGQYDTIPCDTVRYAKDWKKGYTIPRLDLDIQNQLKRRGINP